MSTAWLQLPLVGYISCMGVSEGWLFAGGGGGVVAGGSILFSTLYLRLGICYEATAVSKTTTPLAMPQSCAAPHNSQQWHHRYLILTNQDQPLVYKQCFPVPKAV